MLFRERINPEELEAMSLASFEGEIVVVDSQDEVYDKAIRYLATKKLIGFDTESRPTFSPGQPHYGTSLLQLSGEEKAFLFRVKKLGLPKDVRRILASRTIVKVGAAVRDDIKGLQRIESFTPGNFVDLQQMAVNYGISDKSVKKLAGIILGVRISKTQQLSNWEAEELSEAQQRYAATDAWVCRKMYKVLLSNGYEESNVEKG